jgi:transcriptional regulator with XRE-family HTH domain
MTEKTGDAELAQRVRQLRAKKNITQRKLAELTELSYQTVRSIESGERFVSKGSAEKLAQALGVSVKFILSGIEEPKPAPIKPKSRIPDLPPDDPPLTPEEMAALNDPRLGGVFYSRNGLSRLSNRMLRQVALDALSLLKEIEDAEQNDQQ